MIPIFIGMDYVEEIAYHVCASSILRRTRSPVAISPVGNANLPTDLWYRPRGAHDSTDFSNARFAVPALTGFHGWAIFMDCDVIVLEDIQELWDQRDDHYAVMVVKHQHVPKESRKFLGAEQSQYSRKNWSSLMLFNCAHAYTRDLTPRYINTAPGLDLHGFAWAPEQFIGEIKGGWNVLSTGEQLEHPECSSSLCT